MFLPLLPLAQIFDRGMAFIPQICQKLKISEHTQKYPIFDEFVGILAHVL